MSRAAHVRQAPPAAALIEEADAVNQVTADTPLMSTSLLLAAWRGQENRVLELNEASIQDAAPTREAGAIALAEYARAVLYNGLSRYQDALAAAQWTCEYGDGDRLSTWALPELIEAASRSGHDDVAAAALRHLEGRTSSARADWALGIEARSRALLIDGAEADSLYRQALNRLARGRIVIHVARTQLLYGEWLRRQRRRLDAREQLRAAHRMFSGIGAEGFAERGRRELVATGGRARKRTVETRDDLTAQEAEIARLAGAGYTNGEIATELFISPRTVEWHLRKVFPKLGISSRKQLRRALPDARHAFIPA